MLAVECALTIWGTKIFTYRLSVLRLTTAQQSRLEAIPYRSRRAFSYFENSDNLTYHLHPEFNTSEIKDKHVVENAVICGRCHKNCIEDKKNSKFSIAGGLDFGDTRRVNLPELSLVEQCVISRGMALVVIVKLPGLQMVERQPARKGHVIVFPQPDAPKLLARRQQRWYSTVKDVFPKLDDLHQYIWVTFIGSKPQVDAFIPSNSRVKSQRGPSLYLATLLTRSESALSRYYNR